jgi:hypothetical protein
MSKTLNVYKPSKIRSSSMISEQDAIRLFRTQYYSRLSFSQCLVRGHRNFFSKILVREIRRARQEVNRQQVLSKIYALRAKNK